MFKGYIFDLDGTIIDSLGNIGNLLNSKLELRGISPIPIDKYRYLVGDGAKILVQRAVDFVEKRDNIDWSNEDKKEFTNSLYNDYLYTFSNKYNGDVKPYEGIRESLQYLKDNGKFIAICTNKPTKAANLVLDDLFEKDYFDYVVGVEEGIEIKPSPQMINIVKEKLNLVKDEIAYFGDTSTDMLTAKNSGLYSVGVTWGFRDREELVEYGADKIIDNPLEIMNI